MKKFKEETGAMGTDNAAAFDSGPSFPAIKKKGVVGEDAPVNAVGGGEIAGAGVNKAGKAANWGEPGVSPRHQPKGYKTPSTKSVVMAMVRRAPVKNIVESRRSDSFAGSAVFEVTSSLFYELKMAKRKGKHWRTYLNEDDCYQEIREYASTHKKGPIVVRNENTGEMMYIRY